MAQGRGQQGQQGQQRQQRQQRRWWRWGWPDCGASGLLLLGLGTAWPAAAGPAASAVPAVHRAEPGLTTLDAAAAQTSRQGQARLPAPAPAPATPAWAPGAAGQLPADLRRRCGPGAPLLRPLAPGVWQVPAASGEADAANRGRVSNGLLVADGPRLWLLGSGPSPAAGRALACVVAASGPRQAVSDVVSPWARPELVLGVGGLAKTKTKTNTSTQAQPASRAPRTAAGPASGAQGAGPSPHPASAPPPPPRHWAHAEVAQAMAERCPHCVGRLATRLGPAASDLGRHPVHLPTHLLQGDAGQLGPWRWWRLQRAPGQAVTVWRLAHAGGVLWFSPGVLNGEGPGDARDATVAGLLAATGALAALAAPDGALAQHLGEQGAPQGADLPQAHLAYWQGLQQQVGQVQAAGGSEAAPAGRWPGLPEAWARHPWHALNWQRAWRELEAEALGAPPPEPQRGAFQRSLR